MRVGWAGQKGAAHTAGYEPRDNSLTEHVSTGRHKDERRLHCARGAKRSLRCDCHVHRTDVLDCDRCNYAGQDVVTMAVDEVARSDPAGEVARREDKENRSGKQLLRNAAEI